MAYIAPPQQLIERLLSRIEHGNDYEVEHLLSLYERNRKIANDRMRRLRNAGYDEIAVYNRAQLALDEYGTKTFIKFDRERVDEDYEMFRAYVRASMVFTRSNLSKLRNVKKSVDSRYAYWSSRGYDNMMSNDDFLELYKSGLLDTLIELYGSEFIKDANNFLEMGGNVYTLIYRAKDLLDGKIRYEDVFTL